MSGGSVLHVHGMGLTHVGQKRQLNEDAFLVDDRLKLYAVADGMGGHAAGEIASQEALESLHDMVMRGREDFAEISRGDFSQDAVRRATRLIESAVQAATYMVFGLAQAEPDQKGMGTTLSVLALCGGSAVTGQVGDSRVYLVRDGEAAPVTEDHTLIAWQIKQGVITESEAQLSPHRNVITRAVGSRDYVQVDTGFLEVRSGDAFLVCSDGLHGYLENDEIPGIIEQGPELATQRFIDIANERGGKDNITAIVVNVA